MNNQIKVLLGIGVGGARMDFVAGWLGLLDNFLNNHWSIDINTGCSAGDQWSLKPLDSGFPLTEILNTKKLVLSNTSRLTWAGSGHGVGLDKLLPQINDNSVQILHIDTANTRYKNRIAWEFHVKTYMKQDRDKMVYFGGKPVWNIDKIIGATNITNTDRANYLIESFQRYHPSLDKTVTVPHLNIHYDDIFVPGGSKILCQTLAIDAPERYHQYWDDMLNYALSPAELTVWDHLWRYSDYYS